MAGDKLKFGNAMDAGIIHDGALQAYIGVLKTGGGEERARVMGVIRQAAEQGAGFKASEMIQLAQIGAEDGRPDVRRDAAASLGHLHPDAVPGVAADILTNLAAKDIDANVRAASEASIGKIRKAATTLHHRGPLGSRDPFDGRPAAVIPSSAPRQEAKANPRTPPVQEPGILERAERAVGGFFDKAVGLGRRALHRDQLGAHRVAAVAPKAAASPPKAALPPEPSDHLPGEIPMREIMKIDLLAKGPAVELGKALKLLHSPSANTRQIGASFIEKASAGPDARQFGRELMEAGKLMANDVDSEIASAGLRSVGNAAAANPGLRREAAAFIQKRTAQESGLQNPDQKVLNAAVRSAQRLHSAPQGQRLTPV